MPPTIPLLALSPSSLIMIADRDKEKVILKWNFYFFFFKNSFPVLFLDYHFCGVLKVGI